MLYTMCSFNDKVNDNKLINKWFKQNYDQKNINYYFIKHLDYYLYYYHARSINICIHIIYVYACYEYYA